MAAEAPPVPRLGLALKVSHGFGSTAFGVGVLALSGGLLQLYFNQVLGLPAIWVGAVIMATIVVDAVIDPLIGRWSDHLRSPLGRRHTFMYASAVPSALAFYLLWRPPAGLDPPMLLAFMAAALIFARVSISFYEIPSTSLGPELAPDPHERTSLFAWRFVFLVVGGAVLNAVLYQGFLAQDADNPQGMLNPQAYANFGLVIGLFVLFTILISTAATHRRIRTLHVPPAHKTTLKAEWAEVRAVFTYKPLLLIIGAATLHGFAAGTFDGLSAYFNLHFWELRPQDIGMVWIWGTFSAVFALWAAPALSKRVGKPKSVVINYLGWLATATIPPLLRFAGAFPENGSPALLPTLIVNFVLGVTFLIAATATVASMVADAVDAIAARSGRRSEGVTFAVKGVLDKWAVGAGAFAAGAIVTLVGFPVRAVPGTVDPAIVNKLAYIYLPLAVAANVLAVFLISRIRARELEAATERREPEPAPVTAPAGG